MQKWLGRLPIIMFLLALSIQLIRPEKTNPPIDAASEITAVMPIHPEIIQILSRSCNDCHSNHTTWPWYSNVAPVSWLVVHDVNEGRAELNLSQWGSYSAAKRKELLTKICKEAEEGEMPTGPYTVMHSGASLSSDDVQTLCSWANAATEQRAEAGRSLR